MPYQVILFYKYVTLTDPEVVRSRLLVAAQKLSLKGRVLIAEEGINGTLEGTDEQLVSFIEILRAEQPLTDIEIKWSAGTGSSFPKLKVKVRKEIVGTHFDSEIDPRIETAPRITPQELNTWINEGRDFTIVDMRNDYEYASGHFAGSVNPGLNNSRDLPGAIDTLTPLKEKTVLTVCTGGIRCEKMSAYLMKQGFTDVHQLDSGIHGYMQQYPGKDFLGTLYTFDERVTMDFGGDREIVGTCKPCGQKTETYINCANDVCHLHFLICDACNKENACCSAECEQVLQAEVRLHS